MLTKMLLFALLTVCASVPLDKCFSGGIVIKKLQTDYGLPHMCLRDDISMIKTDSVAVQGTSNDEKTIFTSSITRKLLVTDWKNCRPEKMIGGPIMLLSVDDRGHLKSEEYVCQNDCEIKLEKESGLIIFETASLNYYQVSGTTISSGWFKSTTSISLKHTCEEIRVQCGFKSFQIHSCFQKHIECYQYLHQKFIPKNMANSICSNIELIILTVFSIAVFILLMLLAKTYIIFLLIPIFIPFAYIYGKLYSKKCFKCRNCSLPSHPFTKCPKICICGSRYESTERLKIHIEGGLCPGHKYIMTARTMCKSKGCSFILSILLSVFILSFITPVGAESCYNISQIPELYRTNPNKIEFYDYLMYVYIGAIIISVLTAILLMILIVRPHVFLNYYVYNCEDCQMYHKRKNLKFDDFGTNRCGACLCGCDETNPRLNTHQRSRICFSDYHVKIYKIISSIICIVAVLASIPGALAECSSDIATTDCWGLNINEKYKTASGSGAAKFTGFFKGADEDEYNDIKEHVKNFTSMLIECYKHSSFATNQEIEAIYFENHYKQDESKFFKTDDYIKWRVRAGTMPIQVCKTPTTNYICMCIKQNNKCNEVITNFKAPNTEILEFSKHIMQSDMNLITESLSKIINPTAMRKFMYQESINNTEQFEKFSTEFVKMYKKDDFMANMIALASKLALKIGLGPKHLRNQVENLEIVSGLAQMQSTPIKKIPKSDCIRAKCMTPRFRKHHFDFLLCKTKKLIYPWSDKYTNNSNEICYGDANCDIQFPIVKQSSLNLVNKNLNSCYKLSEFTQTTKYSIGRSSCKMMEKGTCLINDNAKQVVRCKDGSIYEQIATGAYGNEDAIDQVCFNTKCTKVFPRDPELMSNCTITIPKVTHRKPKIIDAENIEIYKHHIAEDFLSSLNTYRFVEVAGLPNVVPNFKVIPIYGTRTTTGMDDATFNVDVNALMGTSVGIHVNTPEGKHLMDLIIYIRSANVSSIFQLIYRTGPTIGYNSAHTEICTGSCPEKVTLRDNSWAQFTKESTSTWGCEEYGCLAINTGCLYGQCKDIIKPEVEIYRKISDEYASVEVCISAVGHIYCKIINSLEATIDDKISAQFKTVEAFSIPRFIAVKSHHILVGQINNVGEFSDYCGNVQVINGTTYGSPDPKIDYKCHAASRKDVIIKQCFKNSFASCLSLPEDKNLIIDDIEGDKMNVAIHGKNLGIVSLQIKLGDIKYDLFVEDPDIDIQGSCVGCFGCSHGIVCQATIKTTISALCTVKSNCNSIYTRVKIEPMKNSFSDKFFCNDAVESIELTVCKTNVKLPISLISVKPHLEINTNLNSPIVRETDNKCGTWICKTSNELSKLLNFNVSGFFSKVWHYLIAIIVILLVLLFIRYIIIPAGFYISKKLKEHQMEEIRLSKLK
ncbi:polyprotein [Anopheles A virus]|uniref:Envelopment polyprotein n=1 Tax=Anopheles A virus TaxID=35307 RepID=A0A291NVX1_9VIRU|nr:polyprotein [Anopheles A virus]ATJ04175.1 polyprotein [Anopheles A virus]